MPPRSQARPGRGVSACACHRLLDEKSSRPGSASSTPIIVYETIILSVCRLPVPRARDDKIR